MVPYDTVRNELTGATSTLERFWKQSHREQLWQLMESGLRGLPPGNLISKYDTRDLMEAGYAVRSPSGQWFSTTKGERALRDGVLGRKA